MELRIPDQKAADDTYKMELQNFCRDLKERLTQAEEQLSSVLEERRELQQQLNDLLAERAGLDELGKQL